MSWLAGLKQPQRTAGLWPDKSSGFTHTHTHTHTHTLSSSMVKHSYSASQPLCSSSCLTRSPTLTCRSPVASAISWQVVVLPVPGVPVIKMLGPLGISSPSGRLGVCEELCARLLATTPDGSSHSLAAHPAARVHLQHAGGCQPVHTMQCFEIGPAPGAGQLWQVRRLDCGPESPDTFFARAQQQLEHEAAAVAGSGKEQHWAAVRCQGAPLSSLRLGLPPLLRHYRRCRCCLQCCWAAHVWPRGACRAKSSRRAMLWSA